MKKYIFLIVCVLALITIAGCQKKDDALKLGEESTITIGTDFDVTMEIVEGSVTSDSLQIYLDINTHIEINGGNASDFTIEAFKNGKWYTIETGLRSNTQEAYIFNRIKYMTINFSKIYGTLPSGHYRIVKLFFPWSQEQTYTNEDNFYLAAEFDI